LPLPAEVQEALGELVGAARDGLLALSVSVGLRVVHDLMEREVDAVVGPNHRCRCGGVGLGSSGIPRPSGAGATRQPPSSRVI
jgi:hypothetical protein